jgi:hypothetical protein
MAPEAVYAPALLLDDQVSLDRRDPFVGKTFSRSNSTSYMCCFSLY